MQHRSTIVRYAVAMIAVAFAVLVRVSLDNMLGRGTIPYMTLFVALVFTGWFSGLWPGLLALGLGGLGISHFVVPWEILSEIERQRSATGLFFYFLFGAVCVYLGYYFDRTRRSAHLLARRAMDAEDKVREVLNSIGDGVYAVDRDWRFVFLNPRALSAAPPQNLIGKTFWEAFPTKVATEEAEHLRRAMADRVCVEYEWQDRDSKHWYSNRAFPNDDGGLTVYSQDVTKRKSAEAALKASESRFRTFIAQANAGLVQANADGIMTLVNSRWQEMLGYREEELLGRSILELTDPTSRDATRQAIADLAAGGPPFILEKGYRRKDGTTLFASSSVSAIRDSTGAFQGLIAAVFDISEMKRTEQELRKSEERLKLAQACGGVGVWEWIPSTHEIYWSESMWLLYGREPTDDSASIGEIWLEAIHPADRERVLRTIETSRNSAQEAREEFRILRPDARLVWVSAVAHVDRDGAGCPLRVYGTNLDITERKESEESLRRQSEKLQLVTDAMPALISYVDVENRYRFNNRGYEEWFGVRREEIYGQHLRDVLGEEAFTRLTPYIQDALRGTRSSFEAELPFRRGGTRHIHADYVPDRRADGTVAGYYALITDISERKRAEDALRMSEERFRLMVEGARDFAIITLDIKGSVTSWNKGAEILLGYSADEVMGQPGQLIFTPEDIRAAEPEREIDRALTQGQAENERRHVRKDGTRFWGSGLMMPLRDADSVPIGLLKMMRDRTEAKLAEEALHESQEKLRLATEGAGVGTWELDLRAGTGHWSPEAVALLGGEDLDLAANDWSQAVHSEDRQAVEATWRQALEKGAPYEVEFRVMAPADDGGERWVLSRGTIERDREGAPFRAAGVLLDITERRRSQLALAEQRAREQAYLEHLPVGVWFINASGTIEYGNAAGQKIWSGSQYVHIEQFGAYKGRWHRTGEMIAPEEWAAARAIRNGETSLDEEIDIECFDGSQRTILNSAVPVKNLSGEIIGAVVFNQDITEAKNTEDALRRSEEQLTLVSNTVPALISYLDTACRYRFINMTYCKWFDMTRDQILGRTVREVIGETAWQDIGPCIRKALGGETSEVEAEAKYTRGGSRWIHATYTPHFDHAGSVVGIVGMISDITDRRRMEETLRESDRRKDEFLATLAHELRNPLAPIRNSLNILRLAHTDTAARDRVVDMMERQVKHMVRLVDDLLEVSRISRGKFELRKEIMPLATVVKSAVETAGPAIESSGHKFSIEMPPDPILVEVDPVRMAQVFANLLNNAAKYTEEGGNIWLKVRRDADAVTISVRDTGAGIPAEMLPRVFDLFTQIDRTLGRAQGGLGIGLALVRNIVQLHGGTVEAHSEGPGLGSELIVRLPLAGQEAQSADGSTASDTADASPLSGRRILVVDDNRDAADSLGMLLSFLGAEVRTVYDGLAALEAVSNRRPTIIFLDIGMPGMDGYEVAREIRRQPFGTSTTIIALTGWGQEEDRRRSKDAGFDYHLVKPLDAEAVLSLLKKPKADS